MSNSCEIPECLYPALRLFVDEFNRHLRYFEQLLADPSALQPEHLKVLIHRLHTMRGGAAFLQLEEIKDISREAELHFKNKLQAANFSDSKKELATLAEKLNSQLQQLTSCLSQIASYNVS
ncbi:MAG: Hpt domain-containing protein [Deltaproteobacteria bacterium]|nr:Hpt domain-containing protein [Deltaproteobacteria bacterium]